jgi:ABC-type glycerol-3-phosphate transport system substrate-binding protein
MAQRSQRLTRRAFLTIAAGTAGAGLLAACGGPATQPPVTAPPGAPPTAPRVTASSTSSTGTPTAGTAFNNATIRAWIFGDTGGDVNLEAQTTRRIVEAFGQRYQGRIAVDITPIANPDTDYQDKVQSAAAAKQLPDVLQLDGPFVADYAYRKILGPIGAYFTPDDLGDFVPSIIEQGTWRGKLWSLGAFSSSMGVMVNQTLFAQAGITAPTDIPAAWAWPQFAEAARRLTGNGVRGLDMLRGLAVHLVGGWRPPRARPEPGDGVRQRVGGGQRPHRVPAPLQGRQYQRHARPEGLREGAGRDADHRRLGHRGV